MKQWSKPAMATMQKQELSRKIQAAADSWYIDAGQCAFADFR